jgi:hypothetical protein
MKGKIKVSHVQEITLSFEESEKIDALTLAGKYIGEPRFQMYGSIVSGQSICNERQRTKRPRRNAAILIFHKTRKRRLMKSSKEPPKQATD